VWQSSQLIQIGVSLISLVGQKIDQLGFLTIARMRLLEARVYRLYLPGYSDGVEVLPTCSPITVSTTGYPVPGTTYLGLLWTRMLDVGHYDHKAWGGRGRGGI